MIGVHIRKTFEGGGATKQVKDASYLRAIKAVRRRHPEAGIFLATDNSSMAEWLRGYYPDVVTRPKWFPAPGDAIHFSTDGPERLAGAVDAVAEMFLLASCDYLIYPALSSFSQVARVLSGLPAERVVALRKIDGVGSWWEQTRQMRGLRMESRAL